MQFQRKDDRSSYIIPHIGEKDVLVESFLLGKMMKGCRDLGLGFIYSFLPSHPPNREFTQFDAKVAEGWIILSGRSSCCGQN
jgi:hypothetical protein